MFRKTWFWAAFVGAAGAAAAFAWLAFSEAFPLVSVDVSMGRAEVLESARRIAGQLGCGPSEARAAARFSLRAREQTFVELEGGGSDRVRALVESEQPTLYTWQVRLFEAGERNETSVTFTPAGRPWAFRETLADETPGAALEPEQARALALEAFAASPFAESLGEWEDVERSRELKASGRVDHSFTWRHRAIAFGAGEYRLRLSVAGDRLSGVQRWIEVPESFDRRYLQMRSINEAIAAAGTAGLSALFLAGVGVSLLVLLRRRWLLWKPAFAWGFFIGGLQGLAVLNTWPLAWFGYDTALSPSLFAGLQVLTAIGAFLGTGLLLGLTFVAAEGLARLAFPEHPRLWSLWSTRAASTRSVLGTTVAGYLLVALFFAYEVALYLATSRWLGWWSPIGAFEDPDALATWFPWLEAIATSAQAGFWEEALCRAIPLALAAWLGRRLGRERSFVVIALLLQAVVFGAGHAAYPAQPAYARVLELSIPAIGFGLVFLRFGLLAVVVCHYVYDVVWIALPLFGSSAEGAGLQSFLVGLFALAPLLVVLVARVRTGSWSELGPELRNGSWRPPAPRERERAPAPPAEPLSPRVAGSLGAVGLLGVLLFALSGPGESDAPRLDIPRQEALERARGELQARGVVLDDDWKELASVRASPGQGDELAWRELGSESYRDFLRDWAGEPEWTVRRLRVEGDVVERAEEWRVAVTASGHARVRHVLSDEATGPRLGEDTARALALTELERRFGLARSQLEEVAAAPDRLPSRTDWRFTFRVPERWPGEVGEARAFADIAGAESVRVGRFVHVPEDWSRAQRERETLLSLPSAIGALVLGLALLSACLGSLVAWSAGRFHPRAAVVACLLVGLAGLTDAWNSWPSAVAAFSTTRSWALQTTLTWVGLCALAAALASAVSLLVGFAQGWLPPRPVTPPTWRGPLAGLGVGAALAGLGATAGAFGEATSPTWGDYTAAGSRLPWLTELLAGLPALAAGAAMLLIVSTAIERLTGGGRQRRGWALLVLASLGACAGLARGADSGTGLFVAALAGALFAPGIAAVLRRSPDAAPVLVATWLAFGRLSSGLQGVHPGQALGAGLSALFLLALGFAWARFGFAGGREGSPVPLATESDPPAA